MRYILFAVMLASPAWSQTIGFFEALELSLQSPTVILAQAQLDLAQKQLEISRGVLSGQLSASYTQTWGESTVTVGGTSTTVSLDEGGFDAVTLSASLNVVPLGPNADTIQKAIWAVEEAQRNLADARADARVTAVQAYLNVLRAQESLELQSFALDLAQKQLEAARVRQLAGSVSEQQVLQADIALLQAQNNLAEAQRSLAQTLAVLSNHLAQNITGVLDQHPEGVWPTVDIEWALRHRSDVLKASVTILEAERNAASTRRQYLPSGSLNMSYAVNDESQRFSISAGYDTQSFQPNVALSYDPSFSQGSSSSASSFSVTLGAKIPLETAIFPALEAARLSIEQSQLQASRIEALARLDIANAQRQLEALSATLALSQKILEQSFQSYTTAQARLELGVVTELDVLEAEKGLREAQLNWHKAQDAYLLGLLQYAQSLAVDPMEVFE